MKFLKLVQFLDWSPSDYLSLITSLNRDCYTMSRSQKWFLIHAECQVGGRLSAQVAQRALKLSGADTIEQEFSEHFVLSVATCE